MTPASHARGGGARAAPRPRPPRPTRSLALLRRFEPLIRYTRGERFFPSTSSATCAPQPVAAAAGRECRADHPRRRADARRSSASSADTVSAKSNSSSSSSRCNIAELAAYAVQHGLSKKEAEDFQAGRGRLARVGYGSRFVAALFSVTLLARGRVPGDTAAAARRPRSR